MKKLISFFTNKRYEVKATENYIEIPFTDKSVMITHYELSNTYQYFVYSLDNELISQSKKYKTIETIYKHFLEI